MSAAAGDSAAVTVQVAVSVEDAFAVFTEEIDLWWRHGKKFRIAGKQPGRLMFETHLGGRLFETVQGPAGETVWEVGTVVEWDPPHGLTLQWRGVNFAPDEKTHVEVTFKPLGDHATLVRVVHRDWSTLRDDHPVRHGRTGPDFSRAIGMWWGELLTSMREHVARRT